MGKEAEDKPEEWLVPRDMPQVALLLAFLLSCSLSLNGSDQGNKALRWLHLFGL